MLLHRMNKQSNANHHMLRNLSFAQINGLSTRWSAAVSPAASLGHGMKETNVS